MNPVTYWIMHGPSVTLASPTRVTLKVLWYLLLVAVIRQLSHTVISSMWHLAAPARHLLRTVTVQQLLTLTRILITLVLFYTLLGFGHLTFLCVCLCHLTCSDAVSSICRCSSFMSNWLMYCQTCFHMVVVFLHVTLQLNSYSLVETMNVSYVE